MRIRHITTIVAAMGLALIPISAASATSAGAGIEGDIDIYNYHSLKCLMPGSVGIVVAQYDYCDATAIYLDRDWISTLVPGATATYTLKNRDLNECLAIGGASHTSGAEAIHWTCNGNAEQEWIWDSSGRLSNKESGLCLAIPSAETVNGVTAIQWPCESVSDAPEQKWIWKIEGM